MTHDPARHRARPAKVPDSPAQVFDGSRAEDSADRLALSNDLRDVLARDDELMLEVTESAMMDDLDQARAVLERLKAHGIEAANRRLRHRLPLAGVPQPAAGRHAEDRPYLHREHHRRRRRARDHVVGGRLTRRMGLTTIAEGVETAEQLAVLRKLGCTAAQGYLFSPAVAPAELVQLVKELHERRLGVGAAG